MTFLGRAGQEGLGASAPPPIFRSLRLKTPESCPLIRYSRPKTMEDPEPNPTDSATCCQERLQDLRRRTEEYVRQEPAKAVGIAVGAGMFLAIFPVFSVFGGIARIAFALLRPVLLILGAAKLYEEYQKRAARGDSSESLDSDSQPPA